MRKIKIEIIGGLLSAVMILSSLPVTVLADKNTDENTVPAITSEIITSEPSTETEVVYEETETEPIDENVTSIPEDETGSSQVDLDEDIDPLIDETTETSETTEAPAELIVFDHYYTEIDESVVNTSDLFVQTSDASVFTSNTNVVSNYDDVYIIACDSVEEARYVYSYYVGKVDNITDLANVISIASENNEDNVADLSNANNGEDAIANLNEIDVNDYSGYIALIDTGANADVNFSVVGDNTTDSNGHGTAMLGYIREENPDARVMSIKVFDDSNTTNAANVYAGIKLAIESNVSVINLSLVGADIEKNAIVKEVIQEAIDKDIIVIGAAGNYNLSATRYIPGCVNDVITVGAVNEDGTKYATSNYNADLYVIATSTSEAAARYSGIYTSGNSSDKVYSAYIIPTPTVTPTATVTPVPTSVEDDFVDDRDFDTYSADMAELGISVTIDENGSYVYNILEDNFEIAATKEQSINNLGNVTSPSLASYYLNGYGSGYDNGYCYFSDIENGEGIARGFTSTDHTSSGLTINDFGRDLTVVCARYWGEEQSRGAMAISGDNVYCYYQSNYSITQNSDGTYSVTIDVRLSTREGVTQPQWSQRSGSSNYTVEYRSVPGASYLSDVYVSVSGGPATKVASGVYSSAYNAKNAIKDAVTSYVTRTIAGEYSGNKDITFGDISTSSGTHTVRYTYWTAGNNTQIFRGQLRATTSISPDYINTDLSIRKVFSNNTSQVIPNVAFIVSGNPTDANTAATNYVTTYNLINSIYSAARPGNNSRYSDLLGKLGWVDDALENDERDTIRSLVHTLANNENISWDLDALGSALLGRPWTHSGTGWNTVDQVLNGVLNGTEFTNKYYNYSSIPSGTSIIYTDNNGIALNPIALGTITPGSNTTAATYYYREAQSNRVDADTDTNLYRVDISATGTYSGNTLTAVTYNRSVHNDTTGALLYQGSVPDSQDIGIRVGNSSENTDFADNYTSTHEEHHIVLELRTNKVDDQSHPSRGATFIVYDDASCTADHAVGTMTLSGNNTYTYDFGELDSVVGEANTFSTKTFTYYIMETSPATQVLINGTWQNTIFDANNTVYSITFTWNPNNDTISGQSATGGTVTSSLDFNNTIQVTATFGTSNGNTVNDIFGSITINKVEEANHSSLAGAEFTIYNDVNENGTYDENVDTIYAVRTTTSTGIISLENIPRGQYLVKETAAPEYYEVDPNYYVVTISHDKLNWVVDNITWAAIEGVTGEFINHNPIVGTTLTDVATVEHVGVNTSTAHLVDVVEYNGLHVGETYVMEGVLYDKTTGEIYLDAEGNEVRNSVTFTPETESGSVEVPFSFPIEQRAISVVAVEKVRHENEENYVGIHYDLTDEDQTVYVPDVHTTAVDSVDNDKIIDGTSHEQTIIDTVAYTNLIPGITYTVTGKLVVKKDYAEGEEYEYVKDADGNIITSSTTFTPTTANGSVDVIFTIDASIYAGEQIVVFEDVYYNNNLIISHSDINDEDQTIEISLLLHVKIAKADKDNVAYYLKNAEITIFNADGTIAYDVDGNPCVGITNENGEVEFNLVYDRENTYYAQETKAPAGYSINPEKFEITPTSDRESEGVCLIPVAILDTIIIIPPKTGDNMNLGLYVALTVLSTCGLAGGCFYFFKRRKKKHNA